MSIQPALRTPDISTHRSATVTEGFHGFIQFFEANAKIVEIAYLNKSGIYRSREVPRCRSEILKLDSRG
jgi:hypothetical protein